MASDFELAAQLHSFMESIPVLWTWEQRQKLYTDGGTHTEQRGPDGRFFHFDLHVLEDASKNGRRYIHVAVSITDTGRANGQRGSSTTPLCTSFLLYEDGEADMPLAREIYERPY